MTNHIKTTAARRIAVFAGIPLTGVLLLSACATGSDASPAGSTTSAAPSTTAPTSSPAPTTTSTTDSATGTVPAGALVAAGKTALNAVGSGTVVSIDEEAGGTSWEVVVVAKDGNEKEVHVSGDGKSVTAGPTAETSDAEDLAENKALLVAAKLSYAQAAIVMTDTVAGAVTELSLDENAGAVVWEGDVVDSANVTHSIRINAGSGAVISNQVDTDD